MKKMETNELSEILNQYLGWNKARVKCFAAMLIALIKVRTVNLVELSCAFGGERKVESRYRRIKRFFSHFTLESSSLAPWVRALFGLLDQPLYLSMDRTNWCWGKKHINILMLSIVYKGIALPLFWSLLPKAGNSNSLERMEMIKKFILHFGKTALGGLLADREFIGEKWLQWLLKEEIPFCIRIKSNSITTNSQGKEVALSRLLHDLKPGEKRVLEGKRKLWKQKVYLCALRLGDGELLIVASDQLLQDPIALYSKRWQIETLFGCLKTKGFNFEQTHMTHPQKIEKLLLLLTVAFCWAHKTGLWRHEEKPIVLKKHGRKAISFFRYGLDYLRDILLNEIDPLREKLFLPLRLLKIDSFFQTLAV